ncbi:MAG: hypothetical protein NTY13_04515 [Chlamydiae bacterium]|nr:hypothetical protein [Chlamydiota bacterium]
MKKTITLLLALSHSLFAQKAPSAPLKGTFSNMSMTTKTAITVSTIILVGSVILVYKATQSKSRLI